MKIERESIADIHACRGFSNQTITKGEARFGIRLVAPSAEGTRNVQDVAGPRTMATEGSTLLDGSANHHVADNLPGMGEVAPGEGCFVLAGELEQPTVEAVDPNLAGLSSQRE